MSSKRAESRSFASPAAPLANALLLGAAVAYGVWLLILKGSVTWPPHQLLGCLYTLSGCLALVGPIVLARSQSSERGVGDLIWMVGGFLIWVNDAAACVRGQWSTVSWVTPLDHQTMGLTILAAMLAGWRCQVGGRNWSWSNVTGWILGVFWVGMAIATWLPGRMPSLGLR